MKNTLTARLNFESDESSSLHSRVKILGHAGYPSPALRAPSPLGYVFSVSSAFEAAGGGLPVEPRKNTGPKVPSGTTENSPRFQPWVACGKSPEPRPPSRRSGALARREGRRAKEKMRLERRVLSSLRGLDSCSRRNPAMNRWAILERPCGTSSHDPLNTYALGGERAGMRGRFACLASMSRN